VSIGWSGVWRGLGVPSSWGRGDWGFAIPHTAVAGGFGLRHSPPSSPEGPLQQLEKTHRAPGGTLFFCTPSIPYASLLATVCPGTKKSPQALIESFFPLLR